ncbi:glycosyltransferase family 2 protein [Salinimicrobium sp. GXAS 041]|uniref:glycosyltransferase family 2 protein n=1 Tax=Salinimicrobium sp. GXAS 041 TaxID=3400806 RepID=UPI003C76ECE9
MEIANWLFLGFGIILSLGYTLVAFFSFREIRDYKRRIRFQTEMPLLQSAGLPSISILAPAYNEEANVTENVSSLLNLNYPNFEIVIINDGSKDKTLERLIEKFELEQDHYYYHEFVPTKEVKGIYRSKSKSFRNITVIDKVNGGKADALNVGINCADHEIICCIDVDCVLQQDALLKLIKPFLDSEEKVIASGGIIRVANNCVIENGRIISIHLPNTFLARAQIIEYFRAFLMGRMAWSHLDGLLLISGAFGMFDKETVIEAGGYDPKTVGEDMELLVRMRRMMQEQKRKYKVGFVPDPLCWTEVPQRWGVLHRQRNRWARGTVETLAIHKKMLFNRKYKVLGMLSMPYWIFFEWLAPLIEFAGILYVLLMIIFSNIDPIVYFIFFFTVYSLAVLFSITALFFEEYSFQQYKKPKYIIKLIATILVEPLIFHPFVMFAAVKGNVDLIRGKKNWGEMNRTGFTRKK